jgi:hypothetical protein
MNKTASVLMAFALACVAQPVLAASDKDEVVRTLNKQLHNLSCARWGADPSASIVIRRSPGSQVGAYYDALAATGLLKKRGLDSTLPENSVFWIDKKKVSAKEFTEDKTKGETFVFSISEDGKPLYDASGKGLSLGKIKVQTFYAMTPPTLSADGKAQVSFARMQIGFIPDKKDYMNAWEKFSGVKDGSVIVLETQKTDGTWAVVKQEVVN